MSDNKWKEIAKSEEVKSGHLFSAEISEDESVLVVRRPQGLVAWGDACPHVGCPLSWGDLTENTLTCTCHNARFDVDSGKMLSAPSLDDLVRYEVREAEEKIYIGDRQEPEKPKVSGSSDKTVVIAGAGAGGQAAAEQLRREGFNGRIVMISPEDVRPYDRTVLSKFFLGEEMDLEDIALRDAAFYEAAGIELLQDHRVKHIDAEHKQVLLENGSEIQADYIILATGSRARELPIKGTDLENCFTLRSYKDATAIRKAAAQASEIVVIGASFIGTETAAYLRDQGKKVHLVAPEQVPFENILGERVGQRFAGLHESQGVDLHLGSSVSFISGEQQVEQVELDNGHALPAEMVIIGVGAEPVVEYLEGTGLVRDGAVDVNDHLEASVPGIYAVGDIARVARNGKEAAHESVGGSQSQRVEHWVVAQRHGQEAARSIVGTGHGLAYTPFFWTMQFETPFAYAGYAPKYEEVRYQGDVDSGSFLAGYFHNGSLAAVASIGMNNTVIKYGYLLDAGRSITPEEFDQGLHRKM